jgi:hypothetical protein
MTVRLLVLVACVLVAACGALQGERPAVIAAPSASSRAELSRVASLAFDGVPVTLAEKAFMLDSVLWVDRLTPPGPQGRAATGRTLEEPMRLRLVLQGPRCLLVRDRDGHRFELRGVPCVPVGAR